MTKSAGPWRGGFTLIEALIAIVVLGLVIPTSALVLSDSARARQDAAAVNRAVWLANAVMEQVVADVNSGATDMGMAPLANVSTYLTTTTTGLNARLSAITAFYSTRGVTWTLTAGSLVSANGAATGDSAKDVYRLVTVTASWSSSKGTRTYPLSMLMTDLTN